MKALTGILIVVLSILLIGTVFAGGAQEESKIGELTCWTWTFKCIDEWLVPAFNKIYPDIKIETVPMSHSDTHDKAFVAIATGSGAPDFLTIDSAYIQKFIDQAGLSEMTDFVKPIKKDFPAYKVANDSDLEGRIWAVPFDCGPVGLYYRNDIFSKFGISSPETWDEYIATGKKLMDQGVYITSVSVAAKAMDQTLHGEAGLHGLLTQQQAGSYFDAKLNPTLDTSESVRAMKLIKRMVDEGISANVAQGSPAQYSLFDEGKLATIVSAAWYVNVLYNYVSKDSPAFGNWRVALLPAFDKGGRRASNLGGSECAIPKQTSEAKRELAMKFIEYACTTIEGKEVHASYGEFPAYLPSYSTSVVQEKTFDMFGPQKVYKLFAEIAPNVPTNWRIPPAYTEIQRILQAKMNAILTGAVSVEEGLKEAQKEASL